MLRKSMPSFGWVQRRSPFDTHVTCALVQLYICRSFVLAPRAPDTHMYYRGNAHLLNSGRPGIAPQQAAAPAMLRLRQLGTVQYIIITLRL